MANRTATAVLQIGCIALVVILLFVRARSMAVDLPDTLMAAFLVWSLASALFAPNYWLAQRALGISVSSAVVFWAARRLGAQGLARPLLVGVSIATVCAVATALAQAYGMESDYFSLNRAPGGTFGNRNFVAHIAVIGLPALVFVTVTARSAFAALLGCVGAAAIAALLVLSRTRAAWLALVVAVVAVAIPLIASRRYWRGHHVGARFWTLALGSAGRATRRIWRPPATWWTIRPAAVSAASRSTPIRRRWR